MGTGRVGLKLQGKTFGEWFDLSLRKYIRGEIYAFKALDSSGGEWLLNVCISLEAGKATVSAETSSSASRIHDQIKRKTTVFVLTADKRKFYHPLGVSYIDSKGRLRSKRVQELKEVPPEIQRNFSLDLYDNVVPKASDQMKGKLVVIVDPDKPEKMAELFMLEKIEPVI